MEKEQTTREKKEEFLNKAEKKSESAIPFEGREGGEGAS